MRVITGERHAVPGVLLSYLVHAKDPIDSALLFRRGLDERRQLERFVNQSSFPNFPLNQILWTDSLRVQNAVPSQTNKCSQ